MLMKQPSSTIEPTVAERFHWEELLRKCKQDILDPFYRKNPEIKHPKCFISYCWGSPGVIREDLHRRLKIFKGDLELLGATVYLDVFNLENSINEFMNKISECDYIFLIGTPALKLRLEKPGNNNLKTEFELIHQKVKTSPNCLCPLIFQGNGDFGAALAETLAFTFGSESLPYIFMRNILVRECRPNGDDELSLGYNSFYYDALSGDGTDSNGSLGVIPTIFQMVNRNLIHSYSHLRKEFLLSIDRLKGIEHESDVDLANLMKGLRSYYQSRAECLVKLDDDEEIRVDELFVNLAIVEEETQRLHEHRQLEEEKELLNPKFTPGDQQRHSVSHQTKSPRNEVKGLFSASLVTLGVFTKGRDADNTLKMIHDSETIYMKKIAIKPEDIFNERTIKKSNQKFFPREIVLLGKAGIGKTTLCRYLAFSWASDKIWCSGLTGARFQYVFYLRLKEVASYELIAKERKIYKILYETLWHRCKKITEAKAEMIWHNICLQPERVLFILDGFDEVAELHSTPCEALMSVRQQYSEKIHVLTTSRPHAQISKHSDLVLENIGFIDEDIPKYINQYFERYCVSHPSSDREEIIKSSEKLKEFLILRPKIFQICKVPINLELLCAIWIDQNSNLQKDDLVMSDLYQLMVVRLMLRYLKRIGVTFANQITVDTRTIMTHERTVKALKFLEELALEGFKTGNLILSRDIYQKLEKKYHEEFTNSINDFLEAGFLKAVGDLGAEKLQKESYFIHLSFQEYLTARYYAKQFLLNGKLTKEDFHFFQEQKFNPRYLSVWTYVAGIIRTYGDEIPIVDERSLVTLDKGLSSYFSALLSKPRDIYGVYKLELFVRCGEEAKWRESSPVMIDLLEYLGEWVLGIANLTEGKDREQLLHNLNQLFLTCPFAMEKIRYRGRTSLFNLLTYEAKTPEWIQWFMDVTQSLLFTSDSFILKNLETNYFVRLLSNAVKGFADFMRDLGEYKTGNCLFQMIVSFIWFSYGLTLIPSVFILFLVAVGFPVTMFSLFTGIVLNPLAHIYYYTVYKRRQEATGEFLKLFRFEDGLIVNRLMKLVLNADNETCYRLIESFGLANFAPPLRPQVINTLTRLVYHSDIKVQHHAWRRLLEFQLSESSKDPSAILFQETGWYLFNSTCHYIFKSLLSNRRNALNRKQEAISLLSSVSGFTPLRVIGIKESQLPQSNERIGLGIVLVYMRNRELVFLFDGLESRIQFATEEKYGNLFGLFVELEYDRTVDITDPQQITSIAKTIQYSVIPPEIEKEIGLLTGKLNAMISYFNKDQLQEIIFPLNDDLNAWQSHFLFLVQHYSSLPQPQSFKSIISLEMSTNAHRKHLYEPFFNMQSLILQESSNQINENVFSNIHSLPISSTPTNQQEGVEEIGDRSVKSPVASRFGECACSILRRNSKNSAISEAIKNIPLKMFFALIDKNSDDILLNVDAFINDFGVLDIFEEIDLQFLKSDLKIVSQLTRQNYKQCILNLSQTKIIQNLTAAVTDVSDLKRSLCALLLKGLLNKFCSLLLSCSFRLSIKRYIQISFLPMSLLYIPLITCFLLIFGYKSFVFFGLLLGIVIVESTFVLFSPFHYKLRKAEDGDDLFYDGGVCSLKSFAALLVFPLIGILIGSVWLLCGIFFRISIDGNIASFIDWLYLGRIYETEQVLEELESILSLDGFFDSLLQRYPSRRAGALFVLPDGLLNILRKHLSPHHTAIWQRADGTFAWYKGRQLVEFRCDHPGRLKRDIRAIRLLSRSFNMSFFNCCWKIVDEKENEDEREAEIGDAEQFVENHARRSAKACEEILKRFQKSSGKPIQDVSSFASDDMDLEKGPRIQFESTSSPLVTSFMTERGKC